MVRIASYNVENLFARPKALNPLDWAVGRDALQAYREVNALMQQANYTANRKARMIDLLLELDIYRRNQHGAIRRHRSSDPRWAWLRKNHGSFDREPQDATQDVVITAAGRAEWIGWVELAREETDELGTRMTARVIADVNADIIGVVEAEDRPSLSRFNDEMLGGQYDQVMLIDGNDDRGIDVGLMAGGGCTLGSMRSNVYATDQVGEIFSRDCPQYEVTTPGGVAVHVLVNHFKSQSGGGGEKRARQAAEVERIAASLVASGRHVVVLGDFNEGPRAGNTQADNLAALYAAGSPLVDCYSLPTFNTGGREGTYDSCGLRNRLDYIFISQSLVPAFQGGTIFRQGLWGTRKSRPTAWATYPEMRDNKHQASDHAAVYVDLNI